MPPAIRDLAALIAISVALRFALPSVSLATEVLIFAIAVSGCTLLLGYAGLMSFGQSVFFGGGSYLTAFAMTGLGLTLLPALLTGALSGAILAGFVGLFAIRKRGVYFVMLTLAFSQVAYFLVLAFGHLTGGENGLTDVPRPALVLAGYTVSALATPGTFYIVTAAVFCLVFTVLGRVARSPFGAVVVALRENDLRAEALGFNVLQYKWATFVVAGAVTGLAGALHAMFIGYVPLNNIEFEMSERIVIMAILGGTGSFYGAFLGALVYNVAADVLSSIWPRWLFGVGVTLIAVVLLLRGGAWSGVEAVLKRFTRQDGRS
ncbi:branched-chain amino acid ABC transporter permease [Stella sp.]|uniref:branched-chain amino acid ABC transporter permease n=1 Tax=Stella sp. TaxID=2912054 RepID=UPI0035B2C567